MKYRKIKCALICALVFTIGILMVQNSYILKKVDVFHDMLLGSENSNQINFSHESGYYENAFELKIETDIDADIYYTLDGSVPTDKSEKYSVPILISDASVNANVLSQRKDFALEEYYIPDYRIDKGTIVRAALYDKKRNVKLKEKVATYFVGLEDYSVLAELPVVSVIVDPEDLFDQRTGIYVNGEMAGDYQDDIVGDGNCTNWNLHGEAWERPAHIDYFSTDFTYTCSESVGLRIRGQYGRGKVQKGFNLYAGEQYGNSGITCFWDPSESELDSFSLITQFDDVKVKEWLTSCLADELEIGNLQCYPCSAFLNGEYWGVYFISEKYDENYFMRHYDINRDNLIMVKNDEISIGGTEDISEYEKLKDYVKSHDMSLDANLDGLFQMVDLDSFLDYYCFECYINNTDWPNNNYALWRTRIEEDKDLADKKWRFLLFDTNIDECMNYSSWNSSFLELLEKDDFMPYLFQNKQFRYMFSKRMCDMVNETFDQYRIEEFLSNMGEALENNVSLEKKRFSGEENYSVKRELGTNQMSFFYERADYIRNCLCEQLFPNQNVTSVVVVSDDTAAGDVKVNSIIPNLDCGSWEGRYISGLPISLCAISGEGYEFKEWKVISDDCAGIKRDHTQIEFILPAGGIVIQPVFEAK